MTLPVDGPAAVVRVQNRDLRVDAGPRQRRTGLRELLADLRDLGVDRDRSSVCTDQGAVHLFLPIQIGAPLPIAHRVGAVADIVPCHGAHLALVENGVDRRPVDEARLRLHDPEVLAQEASRQVVGGTVAVRIEMPAADVVVP